MYAKLIRHWGKPNKSLVYARKPSDTWPLTTNRLGKRGYWYGTLDDYQYIGNSQDKAERYLRGWGVPVEFKPDKANRTLLIDTQPIRENGERIEYRWDHENLILYHLVYGEEKYIAMNGEGARRLAKMIIEKQRKEPPCNE